MILLWSLIVFKIKSCKSFLKSFDFSRRSANWLNSSATTVFKNTFAQAIDSLEPSIRNSNLLPVNANGEVRLRSVVSLLKSGKTVTPICIFSFSCFPYGTPFSILSRIAESSSPRKIEMIAGGASLAPRRWSLPAEATEIRSRS